MASMVTNLFKRDVHTHVQANGLVFQSGKFPMGGGTSDRMMFAYCCSREKKLCSIFCHSM